MDTTIQQNVAQYLRELADKVERSDIMIVGGCPDEGLPTEVKISTRVCEVTLKLNYIEER